MFSSILVNFPKYSECKFQTNLNEKSQIAYLEFYVAFVDIKIWVFSFFDTECNKDKKLVILTSRKYKN